MKFVAAALLAVLASAAWAAPPPQLEPSRVARSFVAELSGSAGKATVAWQLPERLALRPERGENEQTIVTVGGVTFFSRLPAPFAVTGEIARRTYPARPDGYSFVYARLGEPVDVVLGRARSGALRLKAGRHAGRAAWRAEIALPPNECAGLKSGKASYWLDRQTLLPLEIVWTRGERVDQLTARYRSVNRAVPRSLFRRPDVGRQPNRRDQGFTRTTPAAADARLSYAVKLPARVPEGFRRAVAGWASRSARTGPEASNPRYEQYFAAVYRRGWERIDVTQRLAGTRGWLNDPFGFECGVLRERAVLIGDVEAAYGEGPEIVPHLYWREDNVLYTVSGPLSRAELIAIAESLEPVS